MIPTDKLMCHTAQWFIIHFTNLTIVLTSANQSIIVLMTRKLPAVKSN